MTFDFVMIGCGRISKRHGDLLYKKQIAGARLVAVCDINPERAKTAGTLYGVPFFTDIDDLVKNIKFDVASILTPSGMHAENSIKIMNYGKHVVVEKPMALTIKDADQMIATAKKNGVQLFVVKQNRYNVPVVKLKQELNSGRFGQLIMGTVRVRWCRDQTYYDQDSWRGTWAQDGGVFTNQASHHVDLLQWVMGEEVESVFAKSGTYLVKTETEDTGVAIIKFKNGAIGIIEATTAARPKDLEGSLSILAQHGSIEIGGFAVNQIKHWNFSHKTEDDDKIFEKYSVNPPNVYGYGHQQYLENVVACLRGVIKNPVDGESGRKSLVLITAIYESIEKKQEIIFPFTPEKSKLGLPNDR